MTKEQYIDQIRNSLTIGDTSLEMKREYDSRSIAASIELAIAQSSINVKDGEYQWWDKTLKGIIPIIRAGEIYVTIPYTAMMINNSKGFLQAEDSIKNDIEILSKSNFNTYKSSDEVFLVMERENSGNTYMVLKGIDKNLIDAKYSIDISLVPPFSQIDDDDEVNIPNNANLFITNFVKEQFGISPMEDKKNNNKIESN